MFLYNAVSSPSRQSEVTQQRPREKHDSWLCSQRHVCKEAGARGKRGGKDGGKEWTRGERRRGNREEKEGGARGKEGEEIRRGMREMTEWETEWKDGGKVGWERGRADVCYRVSYTVIGQFIHDHKNGHPGLHFMSV